MQVDICVCFLIVLSQFAINSLISLVPLIIYQLTFLQNHSRHWNISLISLKEGPIIEHSLPPIWLLSFHALLIVKYCEYQLLLPESICWYIEVYVERGVSSSHSILYITLATCGKKKGGVSTGTSKRNIDSSITQLFYFTSL